MENDLENENLKINIFKNATSHWYLIMFYVFYRTI